MADEARNITLLGNDGDRITVTVSDGTAIAKGSLMQISTSPNTATITSGVNQNFIGIAAFEKEANDGVTEMSVITHCIADLTCGAAESMTLGNTVMTGAVANEVTVADDATVEGSAQVVGVAQETVAGNGIGAVLINVGKQW